LVPDPKNRVTTLDALRGLTMVIMALDHVRDFFHAAAMNFQPDNLDHTTVVLFFTRWITHLCAPVFMFTAGASAFLWWRNGRSMTELSAYLWKRGLWLVFLELTVLRLALIFNVLSGPFLLTILWALGWSMVALSFLSRLPVRALAVLSVAVVALHNFADPLSFDNAAWKVLHEQGVVMLGSRVIVVGYPLIPWIAVMAAGFCFGHVLVKDPETRQKWLLRLGLGMTALFLVLRMLNIYGDPQRWSTQKSPAFTVLSFLKCTKYPPSLDFLLMTLGPGLLLLFCFYRISPRVSNPLVVIGRVPLFYFLAHLFLAHLLTVPFALFNYGRAAFLLNPPLADGTYPPGYGYSLVTVYLVWILVVGLLYPLCVWFGRLKSRSRSRWLAYL
jgi:uncharacterized membrane protein